jgi:hypothetical protein
MPDPKSTPDGEHIEELLSQLKGIFGHLSESEQEEARQKITPPNVGSAPAAKEPTPAEPPPEPTPGVEEPVLPPVEPFFVTPIDAPAPVLEPFPESPAEPAPPPIPSSDGFIPNEVTVPAGASLIPAAVFYPAGRINEAKMVAEKVERITPKFTKVAIVVNVQVLSAFDPKADLKTTIVSLVKGSGLKAVFVLIDKTLDDIRRKAMLAELEPKGIYFQEIPFHQIEKKALYTDMLLGMVFFFDSQKPPSGEAS